MAAWLGDIVGGAGLLLILGGAFAWADIAHVVVAGL